MIICVVLCVFTFCATGINPFSPVNLKQLQNCYSFDIKKKVFRDMCTHMQLCLEESRSESELNVC